MTELAADALWSPTTLAEAREAMAAPGTLRIRGGGTKSDWGASTAPAPARTVETTRLNRILELDPADLVVTVEPGLRLAELQEALHPHGQWVPIDPPHAEATVGGVFSAQDSGPRRLAHGSLRDLVIGVTVVLSDGTVARSGGKVIKNVAGYDLGKLFSGALGSLGLVAQLTLRTVPIAEASHTLRIPAGPEPAWTLTRALMAAPVEPCAVDHVDGALLVRVEGGPAAVDAQAEAVRRLAHAQGLDATDAPPEVWASLEAHLAGLTGETVVRVGARPSALPGVHAAAADAQASLHSHAALGLHTLRLPASTAPDHPGAVRRLRAALAPLGAHAQIRRQTRGLEADPDLVFGAPPASFGVMRRLKATLDPDAKCAPGRFLGGL